MGFSSGYFHYLHYSDGRGYLIFVAIVLPQICLQKVCIYVYNLRKTKEDKTFFL